MREYLAFQARFHRYSFNNCLLIALQKPDATFVADVPVELPASVAVGAPFSFDITGTLTLRDIAGPVRFSIEGRWQGDVVELAGTISFALPNYGIGSVPGGVVAIRDDAEIGFVVAFTAADA